MQTRAAIGGTLRRIVDGISVLVVLGAVVIATLRFVGAQSAAVGKLTHRPSSAEFARISRSGRLIGTVTAPVVLVVYSDYSCGACAEFNDTLSLLLRRYPQHLSVVLKHSARASSSPGFAVQLGAECAGDQGHFAEYHAAAFGNGNLIEYTNGWKDLGDISGVPDMNGFEECVLSRRHAVTLAAQYEEATRLGFSLTPSSLLNGAPLIGAVPINDLDALIASQFPGRRDPVAPSR